MKKPFEFIQSLPLSTYHQSLRSLAVAILFVASVLILDSTSLCMGEDILPKTWIESLDEFRPVVATDSGTVDTVDDLIRISSVADSENPWDVQLGAGPIDFAIRKGDLIEFSFEGRAIDSSSPDNLAFATVYFAKSDPWQTINGTDASTQVTLYPEWRQFHCTARAESDFDVGTVFMSMHCSAQKQKIEIRSPRVTYWGNTPDAKVPFTKIEYEGQGEDADWRIEAELRIREHRMSPVTVQVFDSTGKPMVGVKVRMKQRTHQFAFGTFTDALPLKPGKDAEKYRKAMRQYFNRVTLPRYFADWGTETEEGKIAADNMATWAASEGYQLKTHLLLGPSYLPSRVVDLKDNPDEFKREIELAMDDALARTAKLPMHAWDALDELRTSNVVADVLGESYLASVFNRGHASQPNAKWFINESEILETTAKQNENIERYESTIQRILDEGGKLSGIGFQGHFSESVTSIPKVIAVLDRFAKFNVPLELTEFDVSTRDEAGQADYTRDLLTVVFSNPATTGFTCWGFWEGSMWRPSGAMIRKDWTTKPNAAIWNSLIKKKWWTNAEDVTDSNGQVVIEAFHGRHNIELETDTDFLSKDIIVTKEASTINLLLPGA